MALSEQFDRALATASRLHRQQVRKDTTIPYVSHVIGTCSIALEHGADEDQAIAALLHDVIEDIESVDDARAEVAAFGPEVLRIVPATAAHIHIGPAGVAGPVVVPLVPPTSGSSSGCADITRTWHGRSCRTRRTTTSTSTTPNGRPERFGDSSRSRHRRT